jgi:hypothetical protein
MQQNLNFWIDENLSIKRIKKHFFSIWIGRGRWSVILGIKRPCTFLKVPNFESKSFTKT